jgi:hypothetical protein
MFKNEEASFFDKKQEVTLLIQKEIDLANIRLKRLWHFHNTRKIMGYLLGNVRGRHNGLDDAIKDLNELVDNLVMELSNDYYDRKAFDESLDKATDLVEMITLLAGESIK